MTDQTTLSVAHIRSLQALNTGAMLTEYQIAVHGSLTKWKARQVVTSLLQQGLIATGARRNRYQITVLGQHTLAALTAGSSAGRM